MNIPNFYEELIVFGLLLLAVVGIYIMLKLHYHFAFGLMKNTSSYEKHQGKIEQVKRYLFFVLKVLLWFGLIGTTLFSVHYLSEGESLKALMVEWWNKIPDGFWLEALLVIVRIAVIIVVSRYILKFIYRLLDQYEQKALQTRCLKCNEATIIKFYNHIHNMVKFTFILGVVYRITLFFPFLDMISRGIWIVLILYVGISFALFLRNSIFMIKDRRDNLYE